MVESSFSCNDSLHHPKLTANDSSGYGFMTYPNCLIYMTLIIVYIIVILPLSIFILFHGLQQWLHSRSTSSAATMSHSDCFTYHLVAIEIIGVSRHFFSFYAIYGNDIQLYMDVVQLNNFFWYGQIFFHVLTCLERYLAVAHPITYLSLRNERGIRIRNISIACAWLTSLLRMAFVRSPHIIYLDVIVMVTSFITVFFCSISVLCVLIRPGPGAQGGVKGRVDQSKKRAFYTIMFILGTLLLKFLWGQTWVIFHMAGVNQNGNIETLEVLFNLPGSLVLPLLFMHRKGKSVCLRNNN